MRSYIEFITTPSADTPGTLLYLHHDAQRYLIGNLSEGTQRAILERGFSARKVSDIVLTGQVGWKTLGGCIGELLNLADLKGTVAKATLESRRADLRRIKARAAAEPKADFSKQIQEAEDALNDKTVLNFYGGPNLNYAIACARRFIFRTGMPLRAVEFHHDHVEPWSDKFLQMWAMPVLSEKGNADADANRLALKPSHQSNKRSFDEFSADLETEDIRSAGKVSRDVVDKMFNSDWSLDRLEETPLADVHMPAVPFIKDPVTGKLIRYTGPLPGNPTGAPLPDIKVFVRQPWPAALMSNLPPSRPSRIAVSYIIKNHPQRGKFDPKKAQQHEIQDRTLWGKLTRGVTVQNVHGKDITPDMVLGPGKDGGGFVISDIPSIDYLQPLLERPEWSDEKIVSSIGGCVWLLGAGVETDARFKGFIERLPHLTHFIASPERNADEPVLEAALLGSIRHHEIDPSSFPLPQVNPPPKKVRLIEGNNVVTARPGLRFTLEPKFAQELNNVMPQLPTRDALEVFQDELVRRKVQEVNAGDISSAEQAAWENEVPFPEVQVITLGTGSSLPGRNRNVSGTLVRVPGCGSYILDAGEGTLGTLQRMYSPPEMDELMRDLKMIWISHMHADHHLGIISIIRAWYHAVHREEPAMKLPDLSNFAEDGPRLAIVSDSPMLFYLREYANIEDYGYSRLLPIATRPGGMTSHETSFRIPSPAGLSEPFLQTDSTQRQELLSYLNLSDLKSVFVPHCRGAQAVAITTKSGFKFSYSGDTRPSPPFAEIGQDSHVLIHEATFEDDLRGDALAKKHSTAGEALIVAAKMRAKSVVLTHFSQRYPKMADLGASTAPKRGIDDVTAASLERMLDSASAKDEADGASEDGEGPLDNPEGIVAAPKADSQTIYSLNDSTILPQASINELIRERGIRVVQAFDCMRLRLGDFPRLEKKQPLLRLLYDVLAEGEASAGEGELGDNDSGPKKKMKPNGQAVQVKGQKSQKKQ